MGLKALNVNLLQQSIRHGRKRHSFAQLTPLPLKMTGTKRVSALCVTTTRQSWSRCRDRDRSPVTISA